MIRATHKMITPNRAVSFDVEGLLLSVPKVRLGSGCDGLLFRFIAGKQSV